MVSDTGGQVSPLSDSTVGTFGFQCNGGNALQLHVGAAHNLQKPAGKQRHSGLHQVGHSILRARSQTLSFENPSHSTIWGQLRVWLQHNNSCEPLVSINHQGKRRAEPCTSSRAKQALDRHCIQTKPCMNPTHFQRQGQTQPTLLLATTTALLCS